MKKQQLLIESINYITGHSPSLKIKGEMKDLKVFKDVLNASRNLYEGLHNEKATLQEIEKLVTIKNTAAKRFQEATGKSWPL